MKIRIAALLVAACAGLPGLIAQDSKSSKAVTLTLSARPASVRSEWDGYLDISAVIESGYYIISNTPGSEFLIPANVKFKLNPSAVFGPLDYPKGETKKLGFSEEKLSVYQGKATITAPFKAAAGAPSGRITIQGVFAYPLSKSLNSK